MKKTNLLPLLFRRHHFLKTLLFMKLTTALLLLTCFQVSANAFSQTRITLKLQSTELKKALSIIERKSNYRFLYNEETVKAGTKVDVDASNTLVTDVLDKLFGSKLFYKILENNLVVITGKDMDVQETKLSGKVTSSVGEVLTGVSVKVKGSSLGTQTDGNGNFNLTVPDNAILVFSYVGFVTQEIAVSGRTSVNVSMVASTQKMDEVVVIGYGTASKRDLTGSIVKILGKDIADKPNTNPVASLQGKVSGLSVVNSGKPGQEPDIRLRGTVSKTQTKPLYIVDGIFNDNIDFVNPNDIESIEILKDASSLAIFGVRAANGAIVIATKKGKAGQLTVNFNTSVGVQKIVDKIALTDAVGFKTLLTEQFANQGTTPYQYFNLYNGNTDWQDQLTQKNAIINSNSISITSGSEKNRFYMGIGYINQQGIIKHEQLKKYSLNISDELKVSKAIKIGFNINGYNARLPQLHDFGNAISAAPIIDPFNTKYGVYNQTPFNLQSAQVDNPLRFVEETQGQNPSGVYRVVGNVFTEINFLKNFTFKATYYTDLAFNNSRRYTPLINVYDAVADMVVSANPKTKISQRDNTFSKFQQDYLLTYKKQFNDHGLTVLGGFSTNFNSYRETNGEASQFTTGNALPIPNDKRFWYLDNTVFVDPTSRTLIAADQDLFQNPLPLQWEQSTVSYFARALYNYKGKYLLNASFRRDGSSDISTRHQFQNFKAIGLGWELTKEKFMEKQKVFDFLKLKASIGTLGNQYTAIHYPFYPILKGSASVFGSGTNQQVLLGYSPAFIPDPNLQWETITATDLGAEFGLLKNRLRIEAAYYNKVTNNLLTNYPALNGQKPGITNAGKITNHGIELAVSWSDKLQNGLGYTVSGNLTTLNNVVNSIYKDGYEIFDGPARTRAGDPIGSFYGYVVDGVYQNAADSAKSPNAGYHPGDLKFRDVNGDGKISTDDRTIIGNPTPKYTYGFSLSLNYRGFDIGADFQGVSGNQIYRAWGNGANFARLNYRAARLNRWHGDGTSNTEPWVNDNSSIPASTYMIENGSYLRIRNAQMGYSIAGAALAKAHIKAARIYISGQNLKTFKHNSGYSPEFGGSATSFGVDGGGNLYPVPAIYTVGLNVTF
jgi:TonB-linked SusC/RagA family outer membrane protein